MKISFRTDKYFPLPQPRSRPIDPVGKDFKNSSTTGHA